MLSSLLGQRFVEGGRLELASRGGVRVSQAMWARAAPYQAAFVQGFSSPYSAM